jgi:hypothetical protein
MDLIVISKHDSYGSQMTHKSMHDANHVDTSDTYVILFHGTKRRSKVNPYPYCGLASAFNNNLRLRHYTLIVA